MSVVRLVAVFDPFEGVAVPANRAGWWPHGRRDEHRTQPLASRHEFASQVNAEDYRWHGAWPRPSRLRRRSANPRRFHVASRWKLPTDRY